MIHLGREEEYDDDCSVKVEEEVCDGTPDFSSFPLHLPAGLGLFILPLPLLPPQYRFVPENITISVQYWYSTSTV